MVRRKKMLMWKMPIFLSNLSAPFEVHSDVDFICLRSCVLQCFYDRILSALFLLLLLPICQLPSTKILQSLLLFQFYYIYFVSICIALSLLKLFTVCMQTGFYYPKIFSHFSWNQLYTLSFRWLYSNTQILINLIAHLVVRLVVVVVVAVIVDPRNLFIALMVQFYVCVPFHSVWFTSFSWCTHKKRSAGSQEMCSTYFF